MSDSTAQAARFIYLNKTCFNGIFRVNTSGEFNVPYGWKEPPALPGRRELKSASAALQTAVLSIETFEGSLQKAMKGDFIYLDPPYPPLNGTAYFTHYTMDRFSTRDQERLASCFRALDKLGCAIVVSNADTPSIRKLYKGYEWKSLPVIRVLTCKQRFSVRELLITNFDVRAGASSNA